MEVQELLSAAWFSELMQDVRSEFENLVTSQADYSPVLQNEQAELERQKTGWLVSLGDSNLPESVRNEIQAQWEFANARLQEIEGELTDLGNRKKIVDNVLDPKLVIDRLERLHDVLGQHNPTGGNLELSLHIDRIDCFNEGQVSMRTCRLGTLAEASELMRSVTGDKREGSTQHKKEEPVDGITPRRRARLRIEAIGPEGKDLKAAATFAADPNRFAGLDDSWFWIDEFQVPVKLSWAEKHAAEVARLRIDGMTVEQVVKHLGKSIPTIRNALKHAAKMEEFAGRLPTKQPRRRWHEDHVAEVVELKLKGWGVARMEKHFKKSEPTIRKAIEHAIESGLLSDDT